MLRHGIERCREVCGTDQQRAASYLQLLEAPPASAADYVSVASFITNELEGKRPGLYAAWLNDSIGALPVVDDRVIRALDALDVGLATTNYDHLVERVTGRGSLTWQTQHLVAPFFRGQSRDVLHLHGSYREPRSVVLGARSYAEVCLDDLTQTALRGFLITGTFVFVGCGAGLEDQNFGALLDWSEVTLRNCPNTHYILVRAKDLGAWSDRLRKLPIEPIAFGPEYSDLAPYLETLGNRVSKQRNPQPLIELVAQQGGFDSQWDALAEARTTLTPSAFLQQSRDVAAQLWASGGRRRAALALSGRLMSRTDEVPTEQLVGLELEAAEWLLEDDLASLAITHLQRAEQRLTPDAPPALAARLRALRVRCLDALCAYAQSLHAIEESLQLATGEERERLEVDRAEIYLLQGEFDRIVPRNGD